MTDNEPRTKIWVSRERTIRIADYETLKVSAGAQAGLETFATADEIRDVQRLLETAIAESLDRSETEEKARRGIQQRYLSIAELHTVAEEKKAIENEKNTTAEVKKSISTETEKKKCTVCGALHNGKYKMCYNCYLKKK